MINKPFLHLFVMRGGKANPTFSTCPGTPATHVEGFILATRPAKVVVLIIFGVSFGHPGVFERTSASRNVNPIDGRPVDPREPERGAAT